MIPRKSGDSEWKVAEMREASTQSGIAATVCAVCGNTRSNKIHVAYDKLHGIEGEFTYLECGNCGCVHIINKPEDLSKYYPENYYSYNVPYPANKGFKQIKTRLRSRNFWGNPTVASRALGFLDAVRKREIPASIQYMKNVSAQREDSILDVGCGNGANLLFLAEYGFQNLTGVDLFIEKDIRYPNGVQIWKKSIFDMDSALFDIITLNHSFEHMDEPFKVLRRLHALLRPGKMLLIRIPVADCYAWPHYGINWFSLDAPRHLMLHTRKSLRILTDATGFAIEEISDDSGDAHTLIESEKRLRKAEALDPKVIQSLKSLSRELKKKEQGDIVAVYCRAL